MTAHTRPDPPRRILDGVSSPSPTSVGPGPAPADDAAPEGWRAAVDRELAALFPSEGVGRWRPLGLVLAAVATAAAALLQLGRQAVVAPWEVMWAEDAAPYLTDARALPLLESVPRTFHDYFHVYPRVVAELSTLFHPVRAAEIFVLAAAATAGAVAVTVYRASSGHVREPLLRALLGALVVLSPVAGNELMNNLANLQWYFCLAAFWVLLWRPSTVLARVWQVFLLAVAALSAPLTVVFVPLALLRVVARRRHPAELVAPVVFLAGTALQLVSMLRATLPAGPAFDAGLAVQTYAQRVALTALVGDRHAGRLWEAHGWLWPVVAVLVLGAFVAYAAGRSKARTRWPALAATVTSVGFLVVAVSGRAGWDTIVWDAGSQHFLMGRYLLVPVALAQAVVVLALDDAPERVADGTWRRLAAVVAGLLVFGAGADYTAVNQRSDGPEWRAGIAEAAEECRTTPGLEAAEVKAAPVLLDFAAAIPCEDI
ncbi:MAG TPA: hypothetical protein VM324_12045 [Egibacteraceae bacterium]|nr:hypothetical protein [Egibacteraceae bacterium]